MLKKNLVKIRRLVNGAELCFVVKADAYALGADVVCLSAEGLVDEYLVARCFEGVALRTAGVNKPISVLFPTLYNEVCVYEKYRLTPCVSDLKELSLFRNANLPINLAINSGFNRFGVNGRDELFELIHSADSMGIEIYSVYSHLSSFDDTGEEKRFLEITEGLPYKKHLYATGSVEKCNAEFFDKVRVGLMPYGITSKPNFDCVISLKGKIVFLRVLSEGEHLSYDGTYVAKTKTVIATVDMGYADGFSRKYNGATVHVSGNEATVIGNVCMDVFFIDVSGINAKLGDEVTVIACAEDVFALAKRAAISPHEVLTSIGKRVKRSYVDD